MNRRLKIILSSFLFLAISACSSIPKSVEEWRSNLKSEKIENQTMAYKTYGSPENPIVILLHGLPTSSYLYRNIAPEIANAGFFVLTPDLVGFGGSSKPDEFSEYDIGKQARRFDQLLTKLKINEFNLVVHDIGAIVAFEYMLKKSNQVKSLLVLNTTAYKSGFTPPSEMKMLAGWMGGMMSSMMSGNFMGPYLTGKFLKDNMAHPEKLTEEARDNYWWPIHEGTTSVMRATAKNFDPMMDKFPIYQEMLRNYKGRARIHWGTQDRVLLSSKIVPQFQKDLKLMDSQVRFNDQASHFVQEDDPQSVVGEILLILKNQ